MSAKERQQWRPGDVKITRAGTIPKPVEPKPDDSTKGK